MPIDVLRLTPLCPWLLEVGNSGKGRGQDNRTLYCSSFASVKRSEIVFPMAQKCLRHRETIWLEEGRTAEPQWRWKSGLGLRPSGQGTRAFRVGGTGKMSCSNFAVTVNKEPSSTRNRTKGDTCDIEFPRHLWSVSSGYQARHTDAFRFPHSFPEQEHTHGAWIQALGLAQGHGDFFELYDFQTSNHHFGLWRDFVIFLKGKDILVWWYNTENSFQTTLKQWGELFFSTDMRGINYFLLSY